MKITYTPSQFKPITIVIETQEEKNALQQAFKVVFENFSFDSPSEQMAKTILDDIGWPDTEDE